MSATTEHDRIREAARAEVQNAPPPSGNQLALVTALLGPATAEAAARRRTEEDTAQGAA